MALWSSSLIVMRFALRFVWKGLPRPSSLPRHRRLLLLLLMIPLVGSPPWMGALTAVPPCFRLGLRMLLVPMCKAFFTRKELMVAGEPSDRLLQMPPGF